MGCAMQTIETKNKPEEFYIVLGFALDYF